MGDAHGCSRWVLGPPKTEIALEPWGSVISGHLRGLLLSFVTEWRGGNQAGDKYAEKVLPSPEYCYILWGFCKEKSCRPRWSALGKCLVSFLLIRFTASSLELQHAWLGLCLSEALKSLFWRITYKREKLLLPRHLPSLWFPLRMDIKHVMILVTSAVILICCLNPFFSKLNSSLFFYWSERICLFCLLSFLLLSSPFSDGK